MDIRDISYIARSNSKFDIENNSVKNAGNRKENKIDDFSDNNSFEAKLKRAMDQNDEKALKEVCQNFEEIFLQMMYKQMKATVPKSDLISEGAGREIFDSMLDEALMEEASKGNGIGLADMMYKQLYKSMSNVYKKDIAEE
ncbi:MAG TPA: rod-binding protein [Clostridiales bacterium]|nr:rod-binding protein [Clostridiales bacterium]